MGNSVAIPLFTHDLRLHTGRDSVAESVERRFPKWKVGEFDSWSNQPDDLQQNLHFSLPSQALGITRIGQGLVRSVS